MKQLKRTIKIVFIIIFILIFSIIIIKNNNEKISEKQEVEEIEKIIADDTTTENSEYTYILSNELITNLLDYISEKDKKISNVEAIMSLLDEEYIKENGITNDNVIDFLKEYQDIDSYFSKEIYIKEIQQLHASIGKYFYIKGIARQDGQEKNIYVVIKQDRVNLTYSITFINEDEFNLKDKDNEKITIYKNDYNSIYAKEISDYQICSEYLQDYINTVKNNPEIAYELLDNDYKEKRFGNKEKYVEYINSIKERLEFTVLRQYSIERQEDKKVQYVCVDQRGSYYIFEKTNMMNYTVILDTYTIDSSQFLAKYNSANTSEKVGYNIQKCIESINNKDYSYIYNKLDNTFKSNNYMTLESFERIIKEKLFDLNKIANSSCSNEGDTYIYTLNIVDIENENNIQDMIIIMQLKEGTDFVMSFSFE